jgi:hypothetical protein
VWQAGFIDELCKLAARVPFLHGTSAAHGLLQPGVGRTVLKTDPNPRAVYTAMKNRRVQPHIAQFARDAVRERGGRPLLAVGKMDTKKGWRPSQLNAWGKKHIGSLDDAHALVDELETAVGPRRGQIWRLLQQGTGSWRNLDLAAPLKPAGYRSAG